MDISEALEEDQKKELEEYVSTVLRFFRSSELNYWIGNPSVEITSGEIYLQPLKTEDTGGKENRNNLKALVKRWEGFVPGKGRCLLLLGIPNSKSPVQVCEAIDEGLIMLEESRVVKTSESGFYAFLMCFADEGKAANFYQRYFGQPYNSLEKQLILLRQVVGLTVHFDEFTLGDRHKQFTIIRKKSSADFSQKVEPENIFMSYNLGQVSTQQARPNFTCAICFEEMLEKECPSSPTKTHCEHLENGRKGIVSILCGHYFHWDCLARWSEKTCPLCRYHQQPPKLSFCEICNVSKDLWLCLICGRKLCCGDENCDITDSNSHIFIHFKETSHALAMEIETKFVYDFSSKDFIHRVYQVEGSNALHSGQKKGKKDVGQLVKDYSSMMKEQLDEQRNYFLGRLSETKEKQQQTLRQLMDAREQLSKQIEELEKESNFSFEQDDEQTRQLQKEQTVCERYRRLLLERIKVIEVQVEAEESKARDEEYRLMQQIREKREEVKDIQRNLDLNHKLQKKMKGQKIASEFFLNKK